MAGIQVQLLGRLAFLIASSDVEVGATFHRLLYIGIPEAVMLQSVEAAIVHQVLGRYLIEPIVLWWRHLIG